MGREDRPADVAVLEAVYGPARRDTLGSAVFYAPRVEPGKTLAERALAKYKEFLGECWERLGESNWLGGWKPLYERTSGAEPDIVRELRSIEGMEARSLVSMFLEGISDRTRAVAALSGSFDRADVRELRVFQTGDGGAYSGLLIASARASGEDVVLIFQYD